MTESGGVRVVENNRLLGALPEEELEQLRPHLGVMTMEQRTLLVEANEPATHVYFPLEGIVSLVASTEDGREVEVGTIGNEGMLGIPLFLGRETIPLRSFCQVPGSAAWMTAEDFGREVVPGTRLHELIRHYIEATFVFASQSALCNQMHSIEQRAARWLLHTDDRVGGGEFSLSQQFMAQMLGVRRASVSEVASDFQQQGLIRYGRGIVRVLDRRGLEQRACECYRIIAKEFDRLPD